MSDIPLGPHAARRQRLNQGLATLSAWCQVRASGYHDVNTTLTMLERKVGELRLAVIKAGIQVEAKETPVDPFSV